MAVRKKDEDHSRRPEAGHSDRPNSSFIEFEPPDPAALAPRQEHSDRAEQLYRTGHRLLGRGFFAEAATAFERAIRYDGSHYSAHAGRSEALVLLGRATEAAAAINHALERYGRNSILGAARGHVFLHEDAFKEASACLETAAQNAPENGYVWLIAGEVRLTIEGGLPGALSCFARATACADPWPETEARAGLALLEWGHAREAINRLTRLVGREADHALGWILLGDAHRVLGEPERARTCYRRAATLVPGLDSVKQALRTGWKAWLSAVGRDLLRRRSP